MKQAVLLHGTGGDDRDYLWFADTKQFLEAHGYDVWWPQLPNARRPLLEESLAFVEENMPPLDEESIIIGHSSACPLILFLLENSMITVKQVVLVAGYYAPIDDPEQGGRSHLMLPEGGFDWDRIRTAAQQFVLINSDNDPWGCTAERAQSVAEELDGTLIVAEGQGHMGAFGRFIEPVTELPLLKENLAA
jgi:predicted alpha/beta hydrolase family esterase